MKTLTAERAAELKAAGKTQIASVVKSVYNSTYYHVNSIDRLLENGGRWLPCPKGQCGDWHGRIGTIGSAIDWGKTARTSEI